MLYYSEDVLNNSGLICTTIWKLLICLMQPFPPDGLMSAECRCSWKPDLRTGLTRTLPSRLPGARAKWVAKKLIFLL
jgi:hypothetical protein